MQIFEAVARAAQPRRQNESRIPPITNWCRQAIYGGSFPAADEPAQMAAIAGGTDVMVFVLGRKNFPNRKLINIWSIPELRRIDSLPDRIRHWCGVHLYHFA